MRVNSTGMRIPRKAAGKTAPPLAVHVIWDATSALNRECVALAEDLYSHMVRDVSHPLSRGLEIPLFMWNSVEHARGGLRLEDFQHSAVVPLVTPEMVTSSGQYFSSLHAWMKRASGAHRLFPAALTKAAHNLGDDDLRSLQSIRLYADTEQWRRPILLRRTLTHELCRLLLGQPRIDANVPQSPAPIKLFISHAKRDGLKMAEEIRDHIRATSALDTFFDANDIAPGYAFFDELQANVETAALIVLKTDAYASREWCRREVLLAKSAGRPVVVINAVQSGEARSFPYLGNVPTVRWNAGDERWTRCEAAVNLALREVLRCEHFRLRAQRLRLPPGAVVLSRPPELCTVVRGLPPSRSRSVLVYPDPPLSDEEVKLLAAANKRRQPITPTALAAPRRTFARVKGKIVALSIGDSPDLEKAGWHRAHVDDVFVEFARHLLVAGARLAYGGDLRERGFTSVLFDLVRHHDKAGATGRLQSYISWPIHLNLTPEGEAELSPEVCFHRVGPASDLDVRADIHMSPNTPSARYAWARCLTKMRSEMTHDTDARVAIGGKISGYLGRMPGIVEEVWLDLRAKRPVYLIGAFGGASRVLIDAMMTGKSSALSARTQESDPEYGAMMQLHRKSAPPTERVNYPEMVAVLGRAWTSGLDNGLTRKQNEELFFTRDIGRMVSLVLVGLATRLR